MMKDELKSVSDYTVRSVDTTTENRITLLLDKDHGQRKTLTITAVSECCEDIYLHFSGAFTQRINGNELHALKQIDEFDERERLTEEFRQKFVKVGDDNDQVYVEKFVLGINEVPFYLVSISNGYYVGWLKTQIE